jgi:hypothetical protein
MESRTVEASAATLYEAEPTDLEYWPQPFKIDLILKDHEGRAITRTPHTPDFLVIKSDSIECHEWREEARLIALSKNSDQFYRDETGWHYRAAEEWAHDVGIGYRLLSKLELPRCLILNYAFLEDYYLPTCSEPSESDVTRLKALLAERGVISFLELLNQEGFAADTIFKAVTRQHVFADLSHQRLDLSHDLLIYRDSSIARANRLLMADRSPPMPIPGLSAIRTGTKIWYNNKEFRVSLSGADKALLRSADGETLELPAAEVIDWIEKDIVSTTSAVKEQNPRLLMNLSPKRLDGSIAKLNALEGQKCDVSTRTLQRWREKIDGASSTLEKLLDLADDVHRRGNRTQRLTDENESLAIAAIDKFHNTPTCKTAAATYDHYLEMCEAANVVEMSYPTFNERVKARESTKAREGHRMDYQQSHIPLHLDYFAPVNGIMPHEICYIDHTIATMATIGAGGNDLGKPTFTVATDGNTTQARAFYLSYDPPSASVVLMVLRDYVRRHSRLPKVIVVDGGKEFRSAAFLWFCRLYGISVRFRPKARPRTGSSIERVLGATETELFARLEGNTRLLRNARMTTKSVNPFDRAEWTLTALQGSIDGYFHIRDSRPHPTLGMSASDYEAKRIRECGVREHVSVKYDEDLLLLTCPFAKRKNHRVDPQRGVWADFTYYWHPSFRAMKRGTVVSVRVERWNAMVVYVETNAGWVTAIARDPQCLLGRTRREVELALREERRRNNIGATKHRRSAKSAKAMLRLLRPENFDERTSAQQREMAYTWERLGMAKVMPEPTRDSIVVTAASNPEPPSGGEELAGTFALDDLEPQPDLSVGLSDRKRSRILENNDDYV